MPRTRMKSGGSKEKKTRHLPTRRRSSPGRSLRDFTSPWPVAAKRTRAASIRAWTTRSRRARWRTAPGRKTTRRITARAGAGLPPGGHRRPVPYGPDPAWPQSRHRRFPAHPVPQEKKWPPAPQCPEGHPRAIEGGCDRRTCLNYNFTGDQPLPGANMWGLDRCWQSCGEHHRRCGWAVDGVSWEESRNWDSRRDEDLWGLMNRAREIPCRIIWVWQNWCSKSSRKPTADIALSALPKTSSLREIRGSSCARTCLRRRQRSFSTNPDPSEFASTWSVTRSCPSHEDPSRRLGHASRDGHCGIYATRSSAEPRFLGFTTISTSWPSATRKRMRRSTEYPRN